MHRPVFALFFLLLTINVSGQNLLRNPSFEAGEPSPSKTPHPWINPENSFRTPPDIHGSDTDWFGVQLQAADGDQFLGLAVRGDGTKESVSQRITRRVEVGTTYRLSLYATQSPVFEGGIRYIEDDTLRSNTADFINPTVLEIWVGMDSYCMTGKRLYRSLPIVPGEWTLHEVTFTLDAPYRFLLIGADFPFPDDPEYGHVLIDDVRLVAIN